MQKKLAKMLSSSPDLFVLKSINFGGSTLFPLRHYICSQKTGVLRFLVFPLKRRWLQSPLQGRGLGYFQKIGSPP
jgi:hypothetical protein